MTASPSNKVLIWTCLHDESTSRLKADRGLCVHVYFPHINAWGVYRQLYGRWECMRATATAPELICLERMSLLDSVEAPLESGAVSSMWLRRLLEKRLPTRFSRPV